MDAQRERELFGPADPSVLTLQATHRSRLISINREQHKTLLRTCQGSSGLFWTFRINEPDPHKIVLHPRVVDKLKVMGFYGPLRCGSFRLDRHLITALVERWRQETHTFHFPIGEATVTLQDIAIIWGLPIEGDPVICNDIRRSFVQWQELCRNLIGIEIKEYDMRNKSAILLTSLSDHVKHSVVINDDSPQEVVDRYARGCALLLLGTVMMPDITQNSVPLVYLHFLEDVNRAGEYSWGSAMLATLYRELCMACHADRISISGPLPLLQIWAWSRITTIQPSNKHAILVEGSLMGVDDRDLGLPPYGARWIQSHNHTESVSHAIRSYRDIFDRLSDEQFIWEPYDMQSLEISTLEPRCLSENWRSQCPLINIGIVEIHYPNRVLRQFGMVQYIPSHVENRDQLLHNDSRKGKSGFDWTTKHSRWIEYWGTRQPFVPCNRINGGATMTHDYLQWYNQITRRLISPVQYTAVVRGFQPSRTSTRDALVQWISKLKISRRRANIDDRTSIQEYLDTSDQFFAELEPILETPPYLVDPPAPNARRHAKQRTARRRRRTNSAECEEEGPSTSRVEEEISQ